MTDQVQKLFIYSSENERLGEMPIYQAINLYDISTVEQIIVKDHAIRREVVSQTHIHVTMKNGEHYTIPIGFVEFLSLTGNSSPEFLEKIKNEQSI